MSVPRRIEDESSFLLERPFRPTICLSP